MSLIYEELTEQVLAACMEVHNQLGCGFLEAAYADALEFEFEQRHIPYQREKLIKKDLPNIPGPTFWHLDDRILLKLT